MQYCYGRGAGLRWVQEVIETWIDGLVIQRVYLTFRVSSEGCLKEEMGVY